MKIQKLRGTNKRTGKPHVGVKVIVSEDEFREMGNNFEGVCLYCGEVASGVEPDARKYHCDACDKNGVFGLEEALLWGRVKVGGSL
jgi:hypothetical protein